MPPTRERSSEIIDFYAALGQGEHAMWLGRLLCLLALFSLSGMDRCVVQSFAWSTMLAERARERGLVEALDSTFSGDEPCAICQAMANSENEEPLAPAIEEIPKLHSPASKRANPTLNPPASCWIGVITRARYGKSLVLEIATPPPQLG
ncbi:MAG: hypothetical protein ACON5H_01965 [Akkermansiaceae bacterium]